MAHSVGIGAAAITATASGKIGFASATIVLYPNQPAGLTRFAELDFSGTFASGYTVINAGDPGVLNGTGWTYQQAANITVQSDATAPQSPPDVWQFVFPTGLEPGMGGGGGLFGIWSNGSNQSWGATEYKELYESTWFKIPTADFETQAVLLKVMGYWGVGDNTNTGGIPTEMYSGMRGDGTGTSIMSSWTLDMFTQGVSSRDLNQNMNLSTKITAGSWHQFETYMKLNDIGSANGIWKWWVDGVLIGSYTDLMFIDAGHPSGFWGRQFDPVWGGLGGTAKTRNDYLWLNHMYLSGIPK